MDSRRLPRTVIDPKVRLVGFFTSGDPPPARFNPNTADATAATAAAISSSSQNSDINLTGNSLSPVMIPPLRRMSPRRCDEMQMPIGSYNPSESLLGTSPSRRGINGPDFSEVATSAWLGISGSMKAAASFPGSSGEMMMVGKNGGNALVKNMDTTELAAKTVPGVTEKDGGTLTDMKNEGAGTVRHQKQMTTRAERRAIQEAQRASKAAAMMDGKGGKSIASTGGGAPSISNQEKVLKQSQKKDGPQETGATSEKKVSRNPDKDRKKDIPQPRMQFDDKNRVEKAKRRAVVNQFEARNRVELFRHLPQYEHGPQLPYLESKFFHLDNIHPSVYKVGLKYLSGTITGGNARCQEMLLAFREAIIDYSTPPEKVLVRDLTSKIGSYVSFLIECRPLSVSMGNAIRFLKNRVAKLHHNVSESEAKSRLISDVDRFINEKIIVADQIIVQHAVTKIRDGDVLLIYGYSTVVEMILLHAHEQGKQFRVMVVDSRPKLEGKILLRKLVMKGLSCTYTHINAISYVMHEVKCVFLGASAILSNGTVFSRVGTACIAMVAHAFRVPVLICCEAYKFHERVQLDSICSNELGNPDVISNVPGKEDVNHLANWADHKNLQLLNLFYDATPSDYVSMIVTEHGMVPPTSVPVIVREYGKDQFIF
ncbi:translation initiation factor eIF-2B subunit delta-like isoform X2 [Dendrobium catenatum]|uniref:translation initiation factor eIF-2B subunit delta-like isoform X2 n=1 Tax=Dendrobium catenatum TaxID=906689 RepID=UPI0009F52763|nr:translation initiation factor eIF-2B subunit delta-like isoform X2 [Dendrobium catenatum]